MVAAGTGADQMLCADARAVEQVARTAFRARFESTYRQYAAVRLGSQDAVEAVAEAVWAQIERGWSGLLRCHSPAEGAWALLARAVEDCPVRPRSPLDRLPRPAVDTFLLRHCLGLDPDRAAETMGVDVAVFESLYRCVVPRPGHGNPSGIFG
ncbi:hypothetical protein [Streptomyces sp. NBC_00536]|uniref:hypothetical protein n=1 Tax=Streptomyces sp. NBC_00536 TaxID=2975769 RepID=UPI002E80E3AF|nr:hypothetical protein [Streptomyces sp. NBC_00536]